MNHHHLWLDLKLAKVIEEVRVAADEMVRAVTEEHRLADAQRARELLDYAGVVTLRGNIGPCNPVYVPFLNETSCDIILKTMAEVRHLAAPNEEEDAAYQMEELVLPMPHGQIPALYNQLKDLYDYAIQPIWVLLMGLRPTSHASVQIAHYKPGPMDHTNWHYDQDSDCTTTVSLNADFTGGGMNIYPGTNLPVTEVGQAALFPGRTLLHRSRPVTSGERSLLVYWTNLEHGS